MTSPALRVVSLVPSVTETLLAWGFDPVAVTRFCEQPGYPTVGGTKNPDVAGIVALQPDLVVVDREENRAEDARALEAAGVRLHVLHIRRTEDVADAMAGLRAAVGLEAVGLEAVGLEAGDSPTGDPAPVNVTLIRAWVPIWRRPWMTIGGATYGSSLLAGVGVANVFGDASDPYPEVTLGEVQARRPDVVLAPSEPYAFSERHRAELAAVAPVVFVDGKDLFWWGARTPGAQQRLGRMARRLGAGNLPSASPAGEAGDLPTPSLEGEAGDLPTPSLEGEDRTQPERPALGR